MLLVVYTNEDPSTLYFISYLKKEKIHHIALEISNDILKSEMRIKDTASDCLWFWEKRNEKISFASISGIYNRVHFLPSCFLEYDAQDIDYVCKEWWSYLVYRFANVEL